MRMSDWRDVRNALALWVAEYPTKKAAAAALGISQGYLGDLLVGNRQAPEWLLEKLGFQRVLVRK